MTEAIFGFIGVIIGAAIPWLQSFVMNKRITDKNAQYLAIRLVCILDKYMEDCFDIVKDNGLSYGQRNAEGYLEAKVKPPIFPIFPDDVDWKSIDHELMYKLLSFPSDIETGKRIVEATLDFAGPPDYEEWFIERRFQYSQFGITALVLSEELCRKYKINKKSYNNWDPAIELREELQKVIEEREESMSSNTNIMNNLFDNGKI